MVFPGVQKSTWTYDDEAKAYYFHRFYDFQPDLNTAHPGGAGGDPEDYGLLAPARGLGISHGRGAVRDREEGTRMLEKAQGAVRDAASVREFLTWREGDAIILAEANVLPETDMEYFGKDGERLQMMFNFQVNQNLFLCAGVRRHPPLDQGAEGDQAAARHGAVGPVSTQSR